MAKPTLLKKWLRKHKLSERDFGERIGCAGAVVHRWASGDRYPETRFALAIQTATKGAVPATYWARLEQSRADRRQRPNPTTAVE